MAGELLLLALGWIFWCVLHSALITPTAKSLFQNVLGTEYAWFRLAYNLFALLTITPLAAWTLASPMPVILEWHWPWGILQALMILAALGLFYAGSRVYPLDEFLGLRQVRMHQQGECPANITLRTDEVLGLMRHPWYLAAFLLLWGRDLEADDLVANIVLTAYLLVGARLEERKLLREFGDSYRRYQQDVSMFFPWKWLKNRFS